MPRTQAIRRNTPGALGVMALASLLAGCADFGAPIGGPGAALPPAEQRFQELDARLADLARKVDNMRSATPTQAINRLEAEVRDLRGEVETLRFNLETREKRARDLYQDLDRRMQKLENEARPARLALEPRIANAPPVPVTQEEEAAYVQAFDRLKAGAFDEAIAGFQSQLAQWPDGRFAVNAWYWTGEAHAAKRDFDSARLAFQNLLNNFPGGDKVPDALFKLGVAEWELKRPDAAKAAWQRVLAEHPQSNAATLARQRLDSAK